MKSIRLALLLIISANISIAQIVGLSPFADICENGETIILSGGTPVGGTYLINGTVGSKLNPSVFGAGVHNITYSYTDTTGTYDTIQSIVVNAAPIVFIATFDVVCSDYSEFNLISGSPMGGIYSGPGVYSGMFFADSINVGSHLIKYVYQDTVTMCSDSAMRQIVVNPAPNVSLGSFTGFCEDLGPLTLTGGSPSGGVYVLNSHDTVVDFNPTIYGNGTFEIIYYYTDGVGCTANDTSTLEVFEVPAKPFVFPWTVDTLLSSSEGDNYEWYHNDTLQSNNTRKYPISVTFGTYSVKVYKSGCESEKSDKYNFGDPISVDDNSLVEKFKVYPNPSDGALTIVTVNSIGKILEIKNMLGQVVYSQIINKSNTNLFLEKAGVYLVEIEGSKLQRVVVRD